ncbi:MAG: hypothetical protein JXB39_08845 [Deltaproteobacteria bacterium]|nr:hypothetical protein [Deltaproteobacteria bacterium]
MAARLPAAGVALFGVRHLFLDQVLTWVRYPHGFLKYGVETWHVALLRIGVLEAAMAVAAGAGLALAAMPARAARWAGLGLSLLAVPLLPGACLPLEVGVAVLLAANLSLPDFPRAVRTISWIPGIELVLPVPVLGSLLPPRWGGLARLVGLLWVAVGWFTADALLGDHRGSVMAWPGARADPRAIVLMRAEPGVRGEFSDVEILGDRAVAVAEESCRLVGMPLGGGPIATWPLPRRFPPLRSGTLDAWVDSSTDLVWVRGGPSWLVGLALGPEGWQYRAKRWFPEACPFLHMVPALDAGFVYLVCVAANDTDPGSIVPVALPDVQPGHAVSLHRANGESVPAPRDAAWVPPLGRLVLAPNYAKGLLLADPTTGRVEPWLGLTSVNAHPLWVPELGRLLVAQPDRASVAVVDPVAGVVERRIPVSMGVRVLAVDAGRGLLVTGSVVTGAVVVRRLDDGSVVDRFGGLMPMIREIALAPEAGIALIATWTVLYAVPYAPTLR